MSTLHIKPWENSGYIAEYAEIYHLEGDLIGAAYDPDDTSVWTDDEGLIVAGPYIAELWKDAEAAEEEIDKIEDRIICDSNAFLSYKNYSASIEKDPHLTVFEKSYLKLKKIKEIASRA